MVACRGPAPSTRSEKRTRRAAGPRPVWGFRLDAAGAVGEFGRADEIDSLEPDHVQVIGDAMRSGPSGVLSKMVRAVAKVV